MVLFIHWRVAAERGADQADPLRPPGGDVGNFFLANWLFGPTMELGLFGAGGATYGVVGQQPDRTALSWWEGQRLAR